EARRRGQFCQRVHGRADVRRRRGRDRVSRLRRCPTSLPAQCGGAGGRRLEFGAIGTAGRGVAAGGSGTEAVRGVYGTTGDDGVDAWLVPAAFWAVTVNV